RRRGAARQRSAAATPRDPQIREPAQRVRSGRRRGDPHPQAAPQRHRRALRTDHRRPLRWIGVRRARNAYHVRDRRYWLPEAPPRHLHGKLNAMDLLYELAELSINGALVGLMYALVALGIVLVFKASSVANLAQGAMVMVGAYLTWAATAQLGSPLWAAIPIGIVAMYMVGRGIERDALMRTIGQPVIMVIMLTLGLEIMLRGLAPAVFGPVKKRLDLGIDTAPIIIG